MPKTKKISEIMSDHNLIEDCPTIIGQIDINKKITKKYYSKISISWKFHLISFFLLS